MARLFGFSIQDTEKIPPGVVSPVPQNNADGSDHYLTSGFFGSYVDIEGVYRTEFELIKRYREMALHPECDSAIEDIVNEGVISNERAQAVNVVLDQIPYPSRIKKAIENEFDSVLRLLDFDTKGHDIFRRWYVDGRLFYHKVIDSKNPKRGIQEVRYIDPRKIKKVRDYLKSITGFKKKKIIFRNKNYGNGKNIIDGVTSILKKRKQNYQ